MAADDAVPTGRMLKRKVDPTSGQWRVTAEWPVLHLGDDQHGTWLGMHRGAPVLKADGTTVAQALDHVWLLPPSSRWVACFWAQDETLATVDIALPPARDGHVWTFDDLELDLWLNAREGAGVVDQDELDAVAHLLPPEVVELAERTADELLRLLQHRIEPFGTASAPWMNALLAMPRSSGPL
ncbi:MAG: DUF402 domain-containing protein [Quadrisphaera sp.]